MIELDDIDDDSLSFDIEYDDPRLYIFNKTTAFTSFPFGLFGIFPYPARFNKTSVALLSGAILFLLINTAVLIYHINSKTPKKKPKQHYKESSSNNERKDKDEKFIYDDYYSYYYEDIYHDDPSKLDENPR